MKKVIPFLLVIAICIAVLTGIHIWINAQEDDLVFTEHILQGTVDPLSGRTISLYITCGDHMRWNSSYTFGDPGTYSTDFIFSQESITAEGSYSWAEFSLYLSGGFGASTSGSFTPGTDGYGQMIRTVAAITQDGETVEMNLKTSDYLDCYSLDYDLSYNSEQYYANETYQLSNTILQDRTWHHNPGSYYRLSRLFRFPVQPDDVTSVSVSKDELGNINSIDMYSENSPDIRFLSAVNDSGVYFIPVFQTAGDDPRTLPGEYPDGLGIYHAPFRSTSQEIAYPHDDDHTEVTLDMDRLENIYPVAEDAFIYSMEVSDDGSVAWLLTQENNVYVLRVIDLVNRESLNRIELFPLRTDSENSTHASWITKNGLAVVFTGDDLALIDLSGSGSLILTAPVEDTGTHLNWFDPATGVVEYDGEHLILVDTSQNHDSTAFWTAVYDPSGIQFLAEYTCSIFDGNHPGYYQSIIGRYWPVSLE